MKVLTLRWAYEETQAYQAFQSATVIWVGLLTIVVELSCYLSIGVYLYKHNKTLNDNPIFALWTLRITTTPKDLVLQYWGPSVNDPVLQILRPAPEGQNFGPPSISCLLTFGTINAIPLSPSSLPY